LSHRTRRPQQLTPTQKASEQIRSGVPACWQWPPPPAPSEDLSPEDVYQIMCEWQDDRCAVCGRRTDPLVTDHDHDTWLVRGILCMRCNQAEVASWHLRELFDRYRERNPASICGLKMRYWRDEPWRGDLFAE
jgi:hypothetical protein